MAAAVLLHHLPLALVSVASMVVGYLVIAGLWWFVFRDKSRARRRERDEHPD
jgi:hypothetical protein